MESSTSVQIGLWTDHSRGFWQRWQILVNDYWAQVLTTFVAVCLALATPYVFKIVMHSVFYKLWSFWSSRASQQESPSARPVRGERQRLLSEEEEEVEDNPGNITVSAKDGLDTTWSFFQYMFTSGARRPLFDYTYIFLVVTLLFGLFITWTIAQTFSARIATDRAALSSSQHCGIWQFDEDAGHEPSYFADLYNSRKEDMASQYARNCYNSANPAKALGCSFFYNQSIAFTTKYEQLCPFNSYELCAHGKYSAVTFDTGYVEPSTIGINALVPFRFRRKTSCAPLSMSNDYIRNTSSLKLNRTEYHYYYGATDSAEWTFTTSGTPFDWLVPGYTVNTYFSSLYRGDDYWHPIPALLGPSGSTLTIMFISSMHNYHIERSSDPLFPAETPRLFENFPEPVYYNADPRARPMACVDSTELCSPGVDQCWSMSTEVPPDMNQDPAYWLMRWSLESSTVYDSIKFRLGNALLARERISQSLSIPLEPNQWAAEASQLFATSLARIQYDASNIANAEDRGRPGYIEVTPDEARGRLCGIYKFKTIDYINVNFLALIGLPLAALAICVLSWDVTALKSSAKKSSRPTRPSEGGAGQASDSVDSHVNNSSTQLGTDTARPVQVESEPNRTVKGDAVQDDSRSQESATAATPSAIVTDSIASSSTAPTPAPASRIAESGVNGKIKDIVTATESASSSTAPDPAAANQRCEPGMNGKSKDNTAASTDPGPLLIEVLIVSIWNIIVAGCKWMYKGCACCWKNSRHTQELETEQRRGGP